MTATGSARIVALLTLWQGVVGVAPPAEASATQPTTLPSASSASPSSTSSVIAVIVPFATSLSMVDALTRLRGEAASVGFEIRLVETPTGNDPLAQLDRVARDLGPAAVVALVGSREASHPVGAAIGTIDVWFLDRATGKTSVGHLSVAEDAGDRADLVLAVRVVDFIRARMFDSLVRTKTLTPERSSTVAVPRTSGRFFLALGMAGTGSFSGFSPAYLPQLHMGYGVRPWLRLTLAAAGLGTQPRALSVPFAGSASIEETLAAFSLSIFAPAWWRIVPWVQAGVSFIRVAIHGDGFSGYLGHDTSSWSPGCLASAGIEVVLSPHLVVQLSGGAMVLVKEPRVYIANVEVARTGRPAWLGSALVGVTF